MFIVDKGPRIHTVEIGMNKKCSEVSFLVSDLAWVWGGTICFCPMGDRGNLFANHILSGILFALVIHIGLSAFSFLSDRLHLALLHKSHSC